MPGNGRQPGRELCRVAYSPARFPRFYESVLDDVLSFLAVLQNPVSDREQAPAKGADDRFESSAIALDGGAVNRLFG
jgi:hypothetical protein